MPLPFDATLKDLVQSHPRDWLTTLALPAQEPVKSLNIDLSVLSAQADCALGIGTPLAWVLHLEFQSSWDDSLVRRMLMYNAILHCRLNVAVHSVVVLLRPAADGAAITGCLEYFGQGTNSSLRYQYEVLRVWERPVELYLRGSLGVLPLAPLGAMPKGADLAR